MDRALITLYFATECKMSARIATINPATVVPTEIPKPSKRVEMLSIERLIL